MATATVTQKASSAETTKNASWVTEGRIRPYGFGVTAPRRSTGRQFTRAKESRLEADWQNHLP